jgi:hypothetical protein
MAARRLNVLFQAEVQASELDITVPFEQDLNPASKERAMAVYRCDSAHAIQRAAASTCRSAMKAASRRS